MSKYFKNVILFMENDNLSNSVMYQVSTIITF